MLRELDAMGHLLEEVQAANPFGLVKSRHKKACAIGCTGKEKLVFITI